MQGEATEAPPEVERGDAITVDEPRPASVSPEATLAPAPAPAISLAALRWSRDARVAARPGQCAVEEHVVVDAEPGAPNTGLESEEERSLGEGGRVEMLYWNSNQAGLSGEIRYRYDARGDLVRIVSIPFESIEGGRPPRPPPIGVRVRRAEDGEVVVEHVERGVSLRTERYRFDAAGRVLSLGVSARDERYEDDGRTTTCEYDAAGRPIARARSSSYVRRYEYDGDALVRVRDEPGPEGEAAEVGHVWATPTGFVVIEGDYVTRYLGACRDVFFEPCAAALAPLARVDAPRPAEPPITLGATPP